MTNKAARIFLIAALFCALVIGFLIIKENISTSASANRLSCRSSQKYSFNPNTQLAWSDSKYFISFNKSDKKLQLNSWSHLNEKFNFDKISEISLACATPGYNCLPPNAKLEVTQFNPPYGLVSVTSENKKQLYPFAWDSKKDLRLGSPLSLCGTNLNQITKGKSFWIKDQLFFYDYKRNVIGSYDMSKLSGASISSAAVDARKVMTITAEGFLQPISCLESSVNEALESFNIVTENNNLFIFKNNSQGIFYSYEEDLLPLFKTTAAASYAVVDDDHKMMYFSDLQNLYLLSGDKMEDLLVDSKKSKLLNSNIYSSSSTPIIYSNKYKRLLFFNSKNYLSHDEVKILNLDNESIFSIDNTFNFTRKNIDFFNMGQLSAEDTYYFIQRHESSAEFSAVTCPATN